MKKSIILFVFIFNILYGCKQRLENRIFNKIESQCREGGCLIDIKSLTNFSWDKMYIFSVQASPEEMQKYMGFKYNGWSDLNSQMVFTLHDSVVYVELQKYNPDEPSKIGFGEDDDTVHCKSFTQASAIFKVDKQPTAQLAYSLIPIEQTEHFHHLNR